MRKLLIYAAWLVGAVALIIFLFFCMLLYLRLPYYPTRADLIRCQEEPVMEARARLEKRIAKSFRDYDAIEYLDLKEFERSKITESDWEKFERKKSMSGTISVEFFLVKNGKRVSRHFAMITCGSGVEFARDGDYAGE